MLISEFKSLKPEGYKTPCPTLGEFLREIAGILETKIKTKFKSKNLDYFVREDKFDYPLVPDLCNEIFMLPFETKSKNVERIIENLKCDVINGAYTEEIKRTFKPDFINVVITEENRNNSLQWFTRAQVLPVIIENVAGPILFGCLLEFVEISLLKDLFRSEDPIVRAFQWLKERYEKEYKYFRSNLCKAAKAKSQKWSSGKDHAPNTSKDSKGLFDYLKDFGRKAQLSVKEKELINVVFFSAKCLKNFFKATENITTKEKLIDAMSKSADEKEAIFTNMWNNETSSDESVDDNYYKAYNFLKDQWKPVTIEPTPVPREKIEEVLENLINLASHPDIHWWQRSRMMGKYALFTGNHDTAIKYYNECMESIWYTGDIDLLESFHEALALASFFNKRSFVKRLKHKGIVFNLFGRPKHEQGTPSVANKTSRSEDFVVEDWEVNAWANDFFKYFPERCFFSSLPVRAGKKKPNYPQIVKYTKQGDFEAVKKILEKNSADVNKLSDEGESAFLFAIQKLNPTNIENVGYSIEKLNDVRIFDLICFYTPSEATIKTATNIEKLTCLGCAVETGKPHIVESVLKLGANVNQKYSEYQLSPLYKAVQQLYPVDPSLRKERFEQKTHPDQLDAIRRWHPLLHSKTNDEIRNIVQKVINTRNFNTPRSKPSVIYPKKDIIEIIKLLLAYKADPNQQHDIGYHRNTTPLMMAAEMNFIEAFKMMVEKGGNPNQTRNSPTKFGHRMDASCWEIALQWKADEIIHFLEENRDRFSDNLSHQN